jgi:hypothetical protein
MGSAWAFSGMVQLLFNTSSGRLVQPRLGAGGRGWAAIVLVAFSMALLDNIVRDQLELGQFRLAVFSILRSGYYLLGPALWLYGQSLVGMQDFQEQPGIMGKRFLLHFIPFIVLTTAGILIPEIFFDPAPREDRGSSLFFMDKNMSTINLSAIRDIGAVISRLVYATLTLRLMIRHGKAVPKAYSNLSLRNTLSWIRLLIISYILLFIVQLSFIGISRSLFPLPNMTPRWINTFIALLRIFPSVAFVFFFSFTLRSKGQYLQRFLTRLVR